MQAIEVPTELWTDILIDFITSLLNLTDPTTGKAYNAILVIVDRFIKYAKFILFYNKYTAKQLGFILLNKLIRYYSISKTIISDRDKLFTSNF